MEYMVLLYVDAEIDARPGQAEWDAAVPAHRAVADAMRDRGWTFSGGALHGQAMATSVRVRGGERLVSDGPFAETKEQLWGYTLVDVPDLDELIEVCAQLCEAEHGTVEIRPTIPLRAPASACCRSWVAAPCP